MKIVLLKDLPKVGRKYEVVDVADGYAMNSLIPARAAEIATDAVVHKYNKLKEVETAARAAMEEEVIAKIDSLTSKTYTVSAKANDQGHLFAAVHKDEIIAAVKAEVGITLDPAYIGLEVALKQVGSFEVPLKVRDMVKNLNIEIVAAE